MAAGWWHEREQADRGGCWLERGTARRPTPPAPVSPKPPRRCLAWPRPASLPSMSVSFSMSLQGVGVPQIGRWSKHRARRGMRESCAAGSLPLRDAVVHP